MADRPFTLEREAISIWVSDFRKAAGMLIAQRFANKENARGRRSAIKVADSRLGASN